MRKGDFETSDRWKMAYILAEHSGWVCNYCKCKLVPFGEDDKYCSLIDGQWVLADGYFWPNIDHIIPVARGGGNNIENLVLACKSCNCRKGNKTDKEFMKETRKS